MLRARRALAQGISQVRRRIHNERDANQQVGDTMPLKRTSGRVLEPENSVSFAATAFASAITNSPVQAVQALRTTLSPAQRLALVDMLRKEGVPDNITLEETFNLADHNKDGLLTRTEFHQAASSSFAFGAAVKEIHAAAKPPPFGVVAKILSGDAIQDWGGAALGLSVMAAAGLGNMVSDVLGIGISGSIERTCNRLGLKPTLSPAQMAMPRTQWSINLGRCLGIAVGCLLGMFPLLLEGHDDKHRQAVAAAAAAAHHDENSGAKQQNVAAGPAGAGAR